MLGARARVLWIIVLGVLAAAVCPRPAAPAPGLVVGATEDMFKLEPERSAALAGDLGLRAARVSLHWNSGQTALSGTDAAQLRAAASTGVRVVVAVYGWRDAAPQDGASREAYCTYVRDLLERVPEIRDVAIWNEPNISYFWRPQFDAAGESAAPVAYAALLARCWDVLHAVRPDVNVIAPATSPWGSDDPADAVVVSHSPAAFLREVGDAYRASGRPLPLFDTVGHHVYGASPGERPWRRHASRRIAQGDIETLVTALQQAFAGTAQPVPGVPVGGRTAPVWYMEAGFETVPSGDKRSLYSGSETTAALADFAGALPWTVLPDPNSPAPDQATQLRDAVRLAYCQPYVEAFFNFLLRDQAELNYWQSGVLWADRTPKASYGAFRDAIGETARGSVDCSLFADAPGQTPPPATAEDVPLTSVPVPSPHPLELQAHPGSKGAASAARRVEGRLKVTAVRWLRGPFRTHRVEWRIALRATQPARVRATVVRSGRRVLTRTVRTRAGRLTVVQFPRRRLRPGRYRIVLQVQALRPPASRLTLRSAVFRVQQRR